MDKSYILDEIRRIATANGGRVPGTAKFFEETGIKVSDWDGKYWARWGDATREAGLSANAMRKAYDEQFLIDKYVALVRELGRLPVKGELLIKKRADPTFPNEKTFKRRFGSKQQIAAKIRDYCQQHSDHDDIIAICESVIVAARPFRADDPEDEVAIGSVYLLKSGRYYKIGRTNAAGRRERELAIQLPERANIVHEISTDDPIGIEAYWHRRFEEKRKNGEWFELASLDVRAFKRRKFQ